MNLINVICIQNLNIMFHIYRRSFNLCGYKVSLYGIICVLAILAALIITIFEAKKSWQDINVYINSGICAIVSGVIFGKLVNVILNWSDYSKSPFQVLNLQHGGMSMIGAFAAVLITFIITSVIKKISIRTIGDTVCIGFLPAFIILSIGKALNGTGFGRYSNCFFAVKIRYDEDFGYISQNMQDHILKNNGVKYIMVHPVFAYEIISYLILFIGIMIYKSHKRFDGEIFVLFLIGYSIIRIVIDAFVSVKQEFVYSISIIQIMWGIVLAAALIFWIYKFVTEKEKKN